MRPRVLVTALAVGLALSVVVGCSSTPESGSASSTSSTSSTGSTGSTSATSGPDGTTVAGGGVPGTDASADPCPVDPLAVVVSVDQWGDIVEQLGGACADVTTVFASSSADPHDYEPTPADIAEFTGAKLVVVNGVDYDPWAEKAVESLDPVPAVVNGGEVVGVEEGDNPHIWYSPDYVDQISKAVTAELSELSPEAAAYFEERAADWEVAMEPYRAEIAAVKEVAAGKSYGATESVFAYMAQAVELEDTTPEGYRNASANESDPAPGDVNEFLQSLGSQSMDVLIYNSQTEGAIPEQIRDAATSASVPVVDVTESVPPGVTSFVEWQVAQLRALAEALR